MNKIKAIYAITVFCVPAIFFAGCFDTPKDLVAPSWDVAVNMPITDTSYQLIEILKPENNPNLGFIDNEIYDSLYCLFSDEIEKIANIQDTIKMPVNLNPEQMSITGAGSGTNNMVFNPDPSYRLDTAMFKSGFLNLNLVNNSATASVNYQLRAPGFKHKTNGSRLVIEGVLSPGQSIIRSVSVQDYIYTQLKRGPNNTDSTQRVDGFLFIGNASSTDQVNFITQVTSNEITLSKLVGKLKRTELAYETRDFEQTFGKEAKDVRSKIKFKAARVELKSRTFGAMKNLYINLDSMTITGYSILPNGNLGNPVKLLFNGQPYFNAQLVAGEEFIQVFDETNSSLPDFLSQMPDVIKMGSKNVIDNISTTKSATISNEDYIKFSINMSAPAYFSVADAGYQDTVEIELTQEEKDNISRGNTANLNVEITNKIPLGIKAKATFLDKNYTPLFTIRNISNTASNEILDVAPSSVDNQGRPSAPAVTNVGITLDKTEFQKFKDASYIVFDVYVRSTGSTSVPGDNYVQIRAKDSVRFKIYGGVNYNLDPEDM